MKSAKRYNNEHGGVDSVTHEEGDTALTQESRTEVLKEFIGNCEPHRVPASCEGRS
jgi:hypothetical protein